jgi:hypothetical protein
MRGNGEALREAAAGDRRGRFAKREPAERGAMSAAFPGDARARTAVLETTAALCVGLLMAAVGPYGTFGQAPLSERLVYWVAVILIAFVVYRPACSLGERLARSLQLAPAFGWSAAVVLASFPLTVVVWLASFRHTPSLWPSFTEYVQFYASVILIGAGLMLVVWLVRRVGAGSSAAPLHDPAAAVPHTAPPPRPRLLDRLPPRLGDELIALEMEDHYVRVHTSVGSDLLLMRMRDAVAEAEGVEGTQVHRSWWVARGAVEHVERDGRRLTVSLRNGLQVPVSRERNGSLPDWLRERREEP